MAAETGRLVVSDEAMRATEKCPSDFACLKGTREPCRVQQCKGLDLYVCESRAPCPYQERFLAAFLCTCPVRLELYRKYAI